MSRASPDLALLAQLALHEQDCAAAHRLALDSVRIARSLEDFDTLVLCLAGLADGAAQQGQAGWAAQLWGAASRYQEARPELATPEPASRGELMHTVRQLLGATAFDAAWHQGRLSTPELVLAASARSDSSVEQGPAAGSTQHGSTEPQPPAGLTRREFEVLLLVAAGHHNAAIAERLVVSNGTVRQHLVSIYQKLGISSRMEAMRYAIDHHLV